MERKEMGRRIKEARKAKNYTVERFAEIMDLSTQTITNIEAGKKGTSVTTLAKICRNLEISSDYILFGKQ